MLTNQDTRHYASVRQRGEKYSSFVIAAILITPRGKRRDRNMKIICLAKILQSILQPGKNVQISRRNVRLKKRKTTPTIGTGMCLLSLLVATPAFPADNFNIEVSNDDIAVEASNASLKELLQELEKLTGIPVKFVEDTDERVTLNVSLTTVENAIGKITPNHMIVHEKLNGKKVIKEVIIIPGDSAGSTGSASGSSFLPSGQPAPAIEAPPQTLPQPAVLDPNSPNPNQPTASPVDQSVDQSVETQNVMPSPNTDQVN